MMTCPKCGKQLTDGTKFCGGCGTKMEETFLCKNCGKEIGAGIKFCPHCGMTAENAASNGVSAVNAGNPGNPSVGQKPWKKITKEMYLLGGIGAGVVCMLILILIFILGGRGDGAAEYAFYVKDRELFFVDLSNPAPRQITSRLVDGNVDNENMFFLSNYFYNMCCVSRDGKTIFYPDRFSGDLSQAYQYGFSIYYRSTDRPEKEPVRIDTGIEKYLVNEDATLVTYRKKDGTFYQYDMKKEEKVKISDGFLGDWRLNYMVSNDGTILWFEDEEEETLYFWHRGEKEKIDSNVDSIVSVSEDRDCLVYVKEGALYRKHYGEDKKRITSDVADVTSGYETGEIYFTKENVLTLIDFVQDDMDPADESANALRQWLSEQVMAKQYSLYYFDGEEEKKIADAVTEVYRTGEAYPAVAFGKYDDSEVRRIKLSEIQDAYSFYDEVKEGLRNSGQYVCYIALEDTVAEIGDGFAIEYFVFDTQGEMACFIDTNTGDGNSGELYRVDIAGDKVQKPEIYDTDVARVYINSQGQMVYFKNYENGKGGELYIDGELVDYEVFDAVRYVADAKKIFYYTGCYTSIEDGQRSGTLKAYAGNKSETVAEDVCRYTVLADGSAICFYDYNSEYRKGDLGLYQKGKLETIGEDVYSYEGLGNAVLYIRDYNRNYFRGDLYLYKNGQAEKLDEDVVCMFPYRTQ